MISNIKSGLFYSFVSIYNHFKYHILTGRKKHNFLSLEEIYDTLNVPLPKEFLRNKKDLYFVCSRNMFYIRKSVIMAGLLNGTASYKTMKRHKSIILSEKEISAYPYILVDNEEEAYTKLVSVCGAKLKAKKVVVTGSTGKTSAKQFSNIVLSEHKKTFCAIHNMNTLRYQGSLLQLISKKSSYFVQELDEGEIGVVGNSSKIIKPDYAIVTNVGISHIQNFGTQERIRDNICEITFGMDKENGVVLYNYDDELLRNNDWNVKTVSCSLENENADCYCSDIKQQANGVTSFNIHFGGQKTELSLKVIGKHNLYNTMYAFVIATLCGEPTEQIRKALLKFRTTGVRQNVIETGRNVLYVDCFNAAPNSMKAAINTLDEMQCDKTCKRVVVLGDMSEFGTESEKAHKMVAQYINETKNIDAVILYGKCMSGIYDLIDNTRFDVYKTEEIKDATEYLKKYKGNGNVILFKGSRCMQIERIIKKLFLMAYLKIISSDIMLYRDI